MPADLCDPAAPQRAIAQAVEHFGRLDLLGATKRADFFTLPEEDWRLKKIGKVPLNFTAT